MQAAHQTGEKNVFCIFPSEAKKERKNSFKERKNSFLYIGMLGSGVRQKNNFCTPAGAKKGRKNSFKERKNSFLHIGIFVYTVIKRIYSDRRKQLTNVLILWASVSEVKFT